MAIQIGRGTIASLLDVSERLVLYSTHSNIIQCVSETPNSIITFQGNSGSAFSAGLSNSQYIIKQGDKTITSFTSNTIIFPPNLNITSGSTSSISLSTSNINIYGYDAPRNPVFSVGSNIFVIRSDTGRIGIGTSSPTEALHITSNIRCDLSVSTSNISLLRLTAKTVSPIDVLGSAHITGSLQVDGGLVFNSLNLSQLNVERIDIAPLSTNKSMTLTQKLTYNSNVIETTIIDDRVSDSNISYSAFNIDKIGRIGIGTTAPSAVLDIYSNDLNMNMNSNTNIYTTSNIVCITGMSNIATTSNIVYDAVHNLNSNVNLYSKAKLVITSDLNIGIGITNPTSVIQTNGIAGRNGLLYMSADNINSVNTIPTTSNVFVVTNKAWIGIGTTNPKSYLNIVSSNLYSQSSVVTIDQFSPSNIYTNVGAYLTCTSNTQTLLSIDNLGHINIGLNVVSDPTYAIMATSNACFPLVKTTTLIGTNSNIYFNKSSLSNINIVQTSSVTSTYDITTNTVNCSKINTADITSTNNFTAYNANVTNGLTANIVTVTGTISSAGISIPNITISSNLFNIYSSNLICTGALGVCFGASNETNAISYPYTEGRVKILLNGSPQVANQISRALTLYGNADVAASINTSWLSGRPLIELHNSAISAGSYSKGLLGMDTNGNIFMGYVNTSYPNITVQYGGILFGNKMLYNSTNGYLSIGQTPTGFTASHPLHVRGNMLVDTNTTGNAPILFVDTTNLRVGINTTVPTYSSHTMGTQYVSGLAVFGSNVTINGDHTVTGTIRSANSILTTSDSSLKTDLVRIKNALDKVSQLTGYTYTRVDTHKKETGLLAQDVLRILPEAVGMNMDNTLSVAYGNIIGLIVESIKELKEDVTKIKNYLILV